MMCEESVHICDLLHVISVFPLLGFSGAGGPQEAETGEEQRELSDC